MLRSMNDIDSVKVNRTNFSIGSFVPKETVGDNQDGMSNSYRSLHFSSPTGESMVLSIKVGFFRSGCCPSRLHQGSFQPLASLAHFATLTLSRTLVVPRTDPCPGADMPMSWKLEAVPQPLS